ncbi:MAG: AMP-binding protein, partial [Lentisphaerae bacterium]|nr:AMP-binding protein [Lentisphaerota bacterium]
EDFAKTDFSHVRTGIMAGSPCPIKVMQEVIEKMNMTQITIVYGQTEASPGCTQSRVDDPIEVRVNTVGRALPGVECKIVDPETGEDLPDNVDGEFVARGYNIMKGYYKMPAATAAAIDKDGWLHTGDLARQDPDGYYFFVGRIKNMIVRESCNISPGEVENLINTHPKVKRSGIIGVPDERRGQRVIAFVVPDPSQPAPTPGELRAFLAKRLPDPRIPDQWVLVDSLPYTPSGKLDRRALQEIALKRQA